MTVEQLERVGLHLTEFHADAVIVHLALKDRAVIPPTLKNKPGTPVFAVPFGQRQTVSVQVD